MVPGTFTNKLKNPLCFLTSINYTLCSLYNFAKKATLDKNCFIFKLNSNSNEKVLCTQVFYNKNQEQPAVSIDFFVK
jgi:hypothetical protein